MHLTYVALHEVTWCTERAEAAAVSLGTSHVSAVSTYTTSVDIHERAMKSYIVTNAESHASAVSVLESGE